MSNVTVTIEVEVPDEISEVYQTEYMRKQFQDRIVEPIKLPHPQLFGADTFDAEIIKVELHWKGSD